MAAEINFLSMAASAAHVNITCDAMPGTDTRSEIADLAQAVIDALADEIAAEFSTDKSLDDMLTDIRVALGGS